MANTGQRLFLLSIVLFAAISRISSTSRRHQPSMSVSRNQPQLQQRQPSTPSSSITDFAPSSPFNPNPRFGFISSNCHFQTIIGSGALHSKFFGPTTRRFETRSERIDTPDGDFFDIEWTKGFEDADKIVLVTHGLESNTKGNLVTRFATAFQSKGFACCLVGFRSCSDEPNRTPGAYHLGFTADLMLLLTIIRERYPSKDIYLSGFSLGGNVVLKLLGELGDKAKDMRIKGCAIACVPFDPVQSQIKLDVGFNRAVYSENFLQTLKKKAEKQILLFPGAFDIEAIRACKTIGDFDEAYIAKIYGFANKVKNKLMAKYTLPNQQRSEEEYL